MEKPIKPALCIKLFGDIFKATHAREVPWSGLHGIRGMKSTLVNAQGAMLVLERVKFLAKKGNLKGNCGERARLIAKTLKEVCRCTVGDMSLENFDAKARLADITNKPAEGHGHELSRDDLVSEHVEGLHGFNKFSRLADGRLQVLVR